MQQPICFSNQESKGFFHRCEQYTLHRIIHLLSSFLQLYFNSYTLYSETVSMEVNMPVNYAMELD